MSLEYKILGQELVSYTTTEETVDTTSYYVGYEETLSPLYVAVSVNNSSIAAYSTDGIAWTETTLPTSGNWLSVTYGNGKFVAVASNRAAYSTDGVNWTQTFTPLGSWYSVAYGDGKFVAASDSNAAAYSTDGITWTQTTMPASLSWYSITYADGKFVAVPYGSNTAAYSTDGINWIQSTMPASLSWYSVTYGDGKFVAVAIGTSTAAYSTDGIAWTQTTMPTSASWRSVAYGDGKFVAVSATPGTAAYSTNGITWTQTTMPSVDWVSVTYGDGKFVAIGSGITAYSTDGITWTQSGALPTSQNYVFWFSVTYGERLQLTETLNIIGGQGTAQTEEFLPITFYTVPAGKQTTVTSVFVANHNDTATTYDFAVVPAGEELSLKHHLRWDMEIAANDFENISTKITMSEGDSLVIFPSTVDTVSVTAFGVEK